MSVQILERGNVLPLLRLLLQQRLHVCHLLLRQHLDISFLAEFLQEAEADLFLAIRILRILCLHFFNLQQILIKIMIFRRNASFELFCSDRLPENNGLGPVLFKLVHHPMQLLILTLEIEFVFVGVWDLLDTITLRPIDVKLQLRRDSGIHFRLHPGLRPLDPGFEEHVLFLQSAIRSSRNFPLRRQVDRSIAAQALGAADLIDVELCWTLIINFTRLLLHFESFL